MLLKEMKCLFFIGMMVVWNNEWLSSWENLNVHFLLAQISSVPFVLFFWGGGGLSRRSKEAAEKSFCSVVDWSHVIVITSSPHSFLESVSVLINSLASAAVWSHDQSEPSLPSAHQQFCCWPLNQNHLPRPQSVVWLVFASAFAL